MNPLTPLRLSPATIAIALGIVVFSKVSVWSQDRVYPLKGGASSNGKIIERTRDKVVIEVRGTNQSFQTNEIARVVFEGEPKQLASVKDYVSQGQIDQAIEEFKKIVPADIKTDEVKQDYQFFKCYITAMNALRGKGDAAGASKIMLEWATENKTSHHFYAASEKLGELAMASGTPAQAAKFFNVLSGSPFAELKIKGDYLSGKALLSNKQVPEAKAKFLLATESKLSDPASLKLAKLASVAAIRCDAAVGKSEQAIQALDKMVDEGDSTDGELYAEIYNAMGGILRTAGNNEEAVLAFLKTDLLYSSQIDAHAEALFQLAQLWPLVGDNQRATDAKSRLAKLYPTSMWLKK